MRVSGIAWSLAGGTLGVSHSAINHETWCDHLSRIQLYELNRDNKVETARNTYLEVNSCVTCLSYHPSEPSILAAGLFNGFVLIFSYKLLLF